MKNLIEFQPKRNSFSRFGRERVRVVERQALRLDVAVARAERRAGVAVRQRRRQDAVRLLVAVADEEAVAAGSER